jgi:pSer/pThr/pTyr-binding forkhead associated (FHA) protein
MPHKYNDPDKTEFFEEFEDEPKSNFRNDNFDDDETIEEGFDRYKDDIDDDEMTMNYKKKRPDILGFIVIKKGKRKNDKYDLTKSDIIIGKNQRCCDIVIDDEGISRIHCRIRKDAEKNDFHFYDCGSTNGSLVNGAEVHHVILKSHDKITLGEDVEIVFIQV